MSNTNRDHLEALSKSKLKMAENQPNLQNWKIVDHTGQKVGSVYDLLFDKEAKKVRYVIANLNNGELLKQNRLILMPVGRARYHESEDEVVFPNVTREQLSSLPDFLTVDRLTKEDEHSVRNTFRSEGETTVTTGDKKGDSFYDHEDFNEDIFYSRSRVVRKENDDDTSPTVNKKEEGKDRPIGTAKKVKAGEDTKTAMTSSENDKKKDEDVNVHPKPKERSTDGSNPGNLGGEREIINADQKSRGRVKGDNNLK